MSAFANGHVGGNSNGTYGGYAGGGGSGGSIKIIGGDINLGTVQALGGVGGDGTHGDGGNGGVGRIRIEYCYSLVGNTDPPASIQQQCLDGPIATIHTVYPHPAVQNQDTVTFRGSGQDQDEGGESIVAYEWHSSLDGLLSTQVTFTRTAASLSVGTHIISFTVQDDESIWSEAITTTLAIDGVNPVASFTVSSTNGYTDTIFTLDASGCRDDEDSLPDLQVRWDWENDSTFDTGWSVTKTITHSYGALGRYTIRLEVRDTDGLTGTITRGVVVVDAPGLPVAIIDSIAPNPATQGKDLIYFNGLSYDTDEGGAYVFAREWRSSIDGLLSTQEDFTVYASEFSPGTHVITFTVQDDEGEWSQAASRILTVQAAQPETVRALILVNRQKLATLYSEISATEVMSSLNALAAHDSVGGLVMQVEDDPVVAAAYAAWDADPTDTEKANAVTAAIRDVVMAQWAAHPDLEYLVIVGDDRVIPFRRVPDQTRYPERRYRRISPDSTIGAALQDNMTLTDDYYGDAVPTVPDSRRWDGHELYIPDLATGRLIETPSEIIDQVDAFLANDEIVIEDAIATGYHFVRDSAWAICGELIEDSIVTDCTLIRQNWDDVDFADQVLNTRHDIISVNGHANHYRIYTPSGYVSSGDIDVAIADHSRSVWYNSGCHAGLNVPPGDHETNDLAQALARHQANSIGNTGYGWGCTRSICLTEQLMLGFTERLAYGQSAVVGRALAVAKQEYYLDEGHFDYYDEKILIESTLYGLPMYRYVTPVGTAIRSQTDGQGTVAIEEGGNVLGDGVMVNSLFYRPLTPTLVITDGGMYYTHEGWVHTGHGEPTQPKFVADLSQPQWQVHGVVFTGGIYTDVMPFDPLVEWVITETVAISEPVFSAPGWYPSVFWGLNRLERGSRLVTLLGQFDPDSQTERVYEQLGFDVYYHAYSSDWTAPSITSMGSSLGVGGASITVSAGDASGIEAVVIAYTDGDGVWNSVGLIESEGMWSGIFPASISTEFFIQVVDGAGNVTVVDNDGRYFVPGDRLFDIYLPLILRNF